jgi:hypothetical protein
MVMIDTHDGPKRLPFLCFLFGCRIKSIYLGKLHNGYTYTIQVCPRCLRLLSVMIPPEIREVKGQTSD